MSGTSLDCATVEGFPNPQDFCDTYGSDSFADDQVTIAEACCVCGGGFKSGSSAVLSGRRRLDEGDGRRRKLLFSRIWKKIVGGPSPPPPTPRPSATSKASVMGPTDGKYTVRVFAVSMFVLIRSYHSTQTNFFYATASSHSRRSITRTGRAQMNRPASPTSSISALVTTVS